MPGRFERLWTGGSPGLKRAAAAALQGPRLLAPLFGAACAVGVAWREYRFSGQVILIGPLMFGVAAGAAAYIAAALCTLTVGLPVFAATARFNRAGLLTVTALTMLAISAVLVRLRQFPTSFRGIALLLVCGTIAARGAWRGLSDGG